MSHLESSARGKTQETTGDSHHGLLDDALTYAKGHPREVIAEVVAAAALTGVVILARGNSLKLAKNEARPIANFFHDFGRRLSFSGAEPASGALRLEANAAKFPFLTAEPSPNLFTAFRPSFKPPVSLSPVAERSAPRAAAEVVDNGVGSMAQQGEVSTAAKSLDPLKHFNEGDKFYKLIAPRNLATGLAEEGAVIRTVESGLKALSRPATEILSEAGLTKTPQHIALAANPSIMELPAWQAKSTIKGGVNYLESRANAAVPAELDGMARQAWFHKNAVALNPAQVNTISEITRGIGPEACRDVKAIDQVAKTVGAHGKTSDYVAAFQKFKAG